MGKFYAGLEVIDTYTSRLGKVTYVDTAGGVVLVSFGCEEVEYTLDGRRVEDIRGPICLVSADEADDPVEHPSHYVTHPSGVECIQITEHMNFCLGNAIKYIWRAGMKSDYIEDLKKARWYIDREIKRFEQTDS